MKATTTCLLVAVLAVGVFKITNVRAQRQQDPPVDLPFPPPDQDIRPNFGGTPGGFPDVSILQSGEFPGVSYFPQRPSVLEDLKLQCLANAGPSAYKDVEIAIENMHICATHLLPNLQNTSDKSPGGMCKFMQTTLHKCLAELTTKVEPCLDKTMKYVPGMSIDTFDSVFKFLCKDDAKHITTLMSSIEQPNTCVNNVKGAARQCLSGTTKLKIQGGAGLSNITKAELCSDIKIMRNCTNQKAKEYCSGEMLEFITGISDAVHTPCSACKIFIMNTFILFVLLLLTKLF